MIDGLYSGAAAMHMLNRQQEIVSTNLMNINTVGHKKLHNGISQLSPSELAQTRKDRFGPTIQTQQSDFSQGPSEQTSRPLDVSVHGDGFLVVETPDGTHFTRDGRLYRDPDSGNLVNAQGHAFQGDGGAITVPAGTSDQSISISQQGVVSADGVELGQLQIVGYENPETLVPKGYSLFAESEDSIQQDADFQIRQGELEKSNVNPVNELIVLIVSSRQYEAVQKATRGISESLREHIQS